MTKVFLALSLALNLLAAALFLKPNSNSSQLFQVDHVTDGDTFVLTSQQQIRLQNINASEQDLCGYTEAKQELESLLSPGTSVRLVGDTTDKFGRRIALVYVDNTLINQQMLISGWAKFTSAASLENDRLKAASQSARDSKLGVYSSLCRQSTNLDNPKCLIKGNHGERDDIYSFPGCGSYPNTILELDEGDVWFCTEAQAQQAGFTKAVNCYTKDFSP